MRIRCIDLLSYSCRATAARPTASAGARGSTLLRLLQRRGVLRLLRSRHVHLEHVPHIEMAAGFEEFDIEPLRALVFEVCWASLPPQQECQRVDWTPPPATPSTLFTPSPPAAQSVPAEGAEDADQRGRELVRSSRASPPYRPHRRRLMCGRRCAAQSACAASARVWAAPRRYLDTPRCLRLRQSSSPPEVVCFRTSPPATALTSFLSGRLQAQQDPRAEGSN